jgi:hypothetical protein
MQGLDKTLFAGCAVAAVLAIGCGNNGDTTGNRTDPADRPGGTPGAAPTSGTADSRDKSSADSPDKSSMTLTGCLQETKGVTGGYILTRANNTGASAPVGTSGRPASGGKVVPAQRRNRPVEEPRRPSNSRDRHCGRERRCGRDQPNARRIAGR